MSTNKFTALLIALAATLTLTANGFAQRWQPLIEPDAFNPDYQFFAPAEYDDFGGLLPPRTGFFGQIVRMHVWMTRPDAEPSNQKGDWTWGNRYDVGYMTDADHGWLFSHWHVEGPNANNFLTVERINRFNEDDDPAEADDDEVFESVNPPNDRNTTVALGTEWRIYRLNDTVNVATFSNWEGNKVFRLDQYHNGAVVEPFFGVRYMTFRDYTIRDAYGRFDVTGLPVPAAPVTQATGVIEQLVNNHNQFENHIVAGQLGMRWSKHLRSRWNLSAEMRVFGGQNFQTLQNKTTTYITEYDGADLGAETDATRVTSTRNSGHRQEFVWGTDVRAEAAYELTRDISVIFGMEFLGFAQGIGRGEILQANEQDLYMVAGTFGVVVNR